jgi:NAD(P)-dependent dehydrogenase (short-subunit alcohol dehydrogenase family)
MTGLRDKVALVTSGSSGIGQVIAIRLGEEGAHVAINYVGRPERDLHQAIGSGTAGLFRAVPEEQEPVLLA